MHTSIKMKEKKSSQQHFIRNELLPSDENQEKSLVIDDEKVNFSYNFDSKAKNRECRKAWCHMFGIMCLIASVLCSLTLWILLKRDSSGEF